MRPDDLRELLMKVQRGAMGIDAALEALKTLPFRRIGDTATIDHHRHLRVGFPEVVLGEGKSAEQIAAIMTELAGTGSNILATRIAPEKAQQVQASLPLVRYEAMARALLWEQQPWEDRGRGMVLVVSAGTGDLAVTEEALVTARLLGNRTQLLSDVGIAGVHRLLAHLDVLRAAEVLVVVAGMEGALPSLVAGLVERPVIAVPTSVGYGASFGGVAALLAMLSSCAAGVSVVNIDNGFGAGYVAALFNRSRESNKV